MKYLNEAKHISELQEICREHLIDLVDKGFEVDMSYHGYLMIDKNKEVFQWSEVMDSIINFVEVFDRELKIGKMYLKYKHTYTDMQDSITTVELDHYITKSELESIKLQNIVGIKIEMEMTK